MRASRHRVTSLLTYNHYKSSVGLGTEIKTWMIMKVLQLHHTLVRCYRMCWVITEPLEKQLILMEKKKERKIKWTRTLSLMLSFLRLRHISVALMCCRVSLANRKRSFSSLGAADAQAAGPKRHLSSSICFTIPGNVHKELSYIYNGYNFFLTSVKWIP